MRLITKMGIVGASAGTLFGSLALQSALQDNVNGQFLDPETGVYHFDQCLAMFAGWFMAGAGIAMTLVMIVVMAWGLVSEFYLTYLKPKPKPQDEETLRGEARNSDSEP